MKFEAERNRLKTELGSYYDILSRYDCYLAGGAIVSLMSGSPINDFDIYFSSKDEIKKFMLMEMSRNYILSRTDKAFTFRTNVGINIQCIYFNYFKTPEDIFKTFDFTVCMGAYRFKDEEFYFHDEFFHHNVQKKLVFNENTAYPIVSLMRVDKYKKKGYRITTSEMLRIIFTVMSKKIFTKKELKEQIGGMYGERYDEILDDIPEEGFDIFSIVDKLKEYQESPNAYKSISSPGEYIDFEEYVYDVLQEKMKYFKYNGKFYRYNEFEDKFTHKFTHITEIKDYYEEVNLEDVIQFPLKVYKYVCKDDGKLKSFYDMRYEYHVGTVQKEDSGRGLFAVFEEEIENCSFSNKPNESKCLLELLVLSPDDMNILSDNSWCDDTFSKLYVNRVVPDGEVKEMINKIKNEKDKDDDWEDLW